MRVPSADDIKRIVYSIVQPLAYGTINLASNFTAKLDGMASFGDGDTYGLTSPYGLSSTPIGGVLAYVLNLQGGSRGPVIVAQLDKKRPLPSAVGEVILYCLQPDGSSSPVKITLGVDGVLKIQASSKIQLICDNVEIGEGTLEKILKGETFQNTFNEHTHVTLGVTSSRPVVPSEPTDLSSKVKAAN